MVFRKRMERAAAAVAAASTIGRRSGLAVSHGMGAAGLCQRHLRASVGTACGVRVLMLMPVVAALLSEARLRVACGLPARGGRHRSGGRGSRRLRGVKHMLVLCVGAEKTGARGASAGRSESSSFATARACVMSWSVWCVYVHTCNVQLALRVGNGGQSPSCYLCLSTYSCRNSYAPRAERLQRAGAERARRSERCGRRVAAAGTATLPAVFLVVLAYRATIPG